MANILCFNGLIILFKTSILSKMEQHIFLPEFMKIWWLLGINQGDFLSFDIQMSWGDSTSLFLMKWISHFSFTLSPSTTPMIFLLKISWRTNSFPILSKKLSIKLMKVNEKFQARMSMRRVAFIPEAPQN